MTVQIDPEFHELISPLTTAELEELEASLKAEGCREALVCWGDLLLDGHNRLEICKRLDIPFLTKSMEFSDRELAMEWIITNQLARRNITLYQRGRLEMKREEIVQTRARGRQLSGLKIGDQVPVDQISGQRGRTDRILGKKAGTSHDTIHKIRVIEKEASEEVKKKLMEGMTTINREYRCLRPKAEKPEPTLTKAERIEIIRDMAKRGYRAEQIVPKVGKNIRRVRTLARESGIVLPDVAMGPGRKLDVNRMINGIVMTAEAMLSTIKLIDSRIEGLDSSRLGGWIESLSASLIVLNGFNRRLKNIRRKSSGKENG